MTINIKIKNHLSKKIRLRVWRYTNGEHLYMLLDSRLTFKYKTYTIKSEEDELESWEEEEELIFKRVFDIWVLKKKQRGTFYLY